MKILIIIGTRPEAIKLAPIVLKLKDFFEVKLCVTGQHQELIEHSLSVFKIVPDISIELNNYGNSLNYLFSQLTLKLDEVLNSFNPDWVFIQGDTTSALAGAICSFHKKIKIAHIEAGLRSNDIDSPFPEEANRKLIAGISSIHFAPTISARDNLLKEGVCNEHIHVIGNTIIDALNIVKNKWKVGKDNILKNIIPDLNEKNPFILVTCHRRESFGIALTEICLLIKKYACLYPEFNWIFTVHPNPNIRNTVIEFLEGVKNVYLIDSQPYELFIHILSKSHFVLTDSGGIQEESISFNVPIIVMRNVTERNEGLKSGYAVLAGNKAKTIEAVLSCWLQDLPKISNPNGHNPYGDGLASDRVLFFLQEKSFEEFK